MTVMRLVAVTWPRGRGPQLRVAGCRVHHGLLGLVLLLHDWRDRRRWLVDLIPHR